MAYIFATCDSSVRALGPVVVSCAMATVSEPCRDPARGPRVAARPEAPPSVEASGRSSSRRTPGSRNQTDGGADSAGRRGQREVARAARGGAGQRSDHSASPSVELAETPCLLAFWIDSGCMEVLSQCCHKSSRCCHLKNQRHRRALPQKSVRPGLYRGLHESHHWCGYGIYP